MALERIWAAYKSKASKSVAHGRQRGCAGVSGYSLCLERPTVCAVAVLSGYLSDDGAGTGVGSINLSGNSFRPLCAYIVRGSRK